MGAARRPFLFGDTSSALRHLPLKGKARPFTEDRRGGHCPSAETAEREDGIFPYNWNLPVGADIIRPPSNIAADHAEPRRPVDLPQGRALPVRRKTFLFVYTSCNFAGTVIIYIIGKGADKAWKATCIRSARRVGIARFPWYAKRRARLPGKGDPRVFCRLQSDKEEWI